MVQHGQGNKGALRGGRRFKVTENLDKLIFETKRFMPGGRLTVAQSDAEKEKRVTMRGENTLCRAAELPGDLPEVHRVQSMTKLNRREEILHTRI